MSDDPRMLSERLAILEKQVRRMRLTAVTAIIVGSTCFLLGQAAPTTGVVEAKDFILRDTEGKLRGRFFMDDQTGGPALKLYDEHIPQQMLQIRTVGGIAMDRDRLAIPRSTFGLIGNRPYLQLADPEGRQTASISIRETGPQVLLYDENEKGGIELLFLKGRGPALTLMDADQNIRARVEVDKTEPFLKVTGSRGQVLFPTQRAGATHGDSTNK